MKINSPKKQAFLRTVSFFLATAVTFNVLSLSAISAASVSDNLVYAELNDAPELYGELPDSAELEKMYLEQLFYGNGSSLYKDYGRTDLTGVPLEIYEFLRDKIEKVASGELTETVFEYKFPDSYTDIEIFNRDYIEIHRHLLNDLPQSFYWFDKTVGVKRGMRYISDGVDMYLYKCEFQFTVSKNYADGNEPYKVDSSKITSAQAAVKKAREIANKYSGLSDYEKIVAYKNEICALTAYDHNAANDLAEVPYGDPWQIVYVFDGDDATNVVCEGYSKAFQYLCDLGGVECYTVTGEMRGGTGAGPHMWNIAVLYGVSYLVDITNCDDGSVGAPDLLLLKGADESSIAGCTLILSPNNTIKYTYDDNSAIYPDDILKVATRDYNPEVHSHAVCAGADNCPSDIHGEHEIIEHWTEWINADSLPSETGYYYLSDDVTLSGTWTVKENIHLCLNGKTIYASDTNAEAVLVEELGALDLCDCSKSGSISRSSQPSDGSGVVNKGIFNMYSGNVSGHYAQYGGGVKNEKEFNMYGGAISGNSAETGGGVYTAEHIFRMCGGSVGENTASSLAGGVYISGGEVVLSGSAVIQGNLINGNANNLYIPSGNKVTLSEPLSEKADIGVTSEDIPTQGAPVTFTSPNNNDNRKFFNSDNNLYQTVNTDKKAVGLSLASIHEHKLCINTDNCPDSVHADHGEAITWTPWTDSTKLPVDEGYYYLAQDVELTESQTIDSGTVSLCLNGHSVTVDSNTVNAQNRMNKSLIVITGTGTVFELCDCESKGKIYGGYASVNGGCININNNSTFNMYSGEISENNTNKNGGGIYSTGTFNMYGGKIKKNTSTNAGGGVYNSGTFNMYGDEISENTSSNNDGGAVYNNSGKNFYMYGGNITSNSAKNGGGTAGNGNTYIYGGKITENTASASGGGVYAYNVTVGGEAFVNDNKLDENSNDLYLPSDGTINVDETNPLTGNAYIGVTTYTVPSAASPVNITGANSGFYSAFFYSNNAEHKIVTGANNEVQLALLDTHQHFLCENTENCPEDIHTTHKSLKWKAITNGKLPTKKGNYYLTSDITVTASWTPPKGETSICLNGYSIKVDTSVVNSSAPMEHGIIYIYREDMNVDDVIFNLCDCVGGGKITGNYTSDNGSGVYNDGTFNMFSGGISGNRTLSSSNGGGVYNSGIFNMYGGQISENTSSSYGGGIEIDGTDATFNMFDGKITNNKSLRGGGVNTSGSSDIFNMYDGEISRNTASYVGGGVFLTGTRNIFNMFGGKIVKNFADDHGGGVCNFGTNSTFKMTGGVITENNGTSFGGGVHIHENGNKAIMGGDAVIYGNNAAGQVDDLYLQSNVKITVDTPFTENAHVGIRTHYAPVEGGRIQFTVKSDTDYTDYFECNDPQCAIQNDGNALYLRIPPHEHRVCTGADNCTDDSHEIIEWTKWDSTNSLPTEPGNYVLKNSIILTKSWTPPAGETSICLNGQTIRLSSSVNSEDSLTNGLININSEDIILNLCDCTGSGSINYYNSTISGSTVYNDGTFNMYSGQLPGNNSVDGCIYNNGTFNMCGGTITGNRSTDGCVYNNGTFNMSNGKITGNSNTRGVYNAGTFNMQGGEIRGSGTVQDNGAGVLVSGSNAEFNMLGGKITGNSSYSNGAGVYVDSGIFNMLGGEISRNYTYNDGIGAGVYVNGSSTVTLGGKIVIRDNTHGGIRQNLYLPEGVTVATDPNNPIDRSSYIWVTTQVLPDNDIPVNVTDKNDRDYHRVFYSDNALYEVANSKNDQVQLVLTTECVHSLVYIPKVEPTCLLPGNEEYYVCERCFKIFKDIHAENRLSDIPEDIEALGHDYGEWIVTIDPIESEDGIGEAIQICKRDESHVRRVALTALIEETPPTCIEEGKRVYEHMLGTVTVNLKKLSHDYESEKWHSDEEKHWQECKNCGTANPYSEKTHEWDEGKITVAPTTEHDGEKIFTCGICGHTRTEKLPKLKPPVTTPSETEPPVTPPSETNPPVTPPSETEPPVTPPSETEPPVTPPSETEPPVTPPSETDPPVTPPSETDPPVTPPSETDPPVTPPSETEPPVTPPSETAPPITPPSETNPPVTPPVSAAVTTYSFVVPVTSGTTAAAQTSPANDSIFSLEFINEDTTTPPTDVAGSISKRVESPDYAAEISDSVQELANNVLEQQEIALVNSGSIIEILLTIDKINTVPAVDGSAIAEKLNGYKMWQYLDINLYKIIDGTRYKLSGTNAPVTIKVVIPETLRTAGRRYAMIRIHDGAVDVLNDLDTNASTITFTTDRFSIYALIYKDKEISNDEPMNTGVDSYTAIFLAAGITALPVSMAFTVIGSGIMGMSEASKNRVYEKIIRWGKGGGKARKAIALALIFLLLSYYYTVGNKAQAEGQS